MILSIPLIGISIPNVNTDTTTNVCVDTREKRVTVDDSEVRGKVISGESLRASWRETTTVDMYLTYANYMGFFRYMTVLNGFKRANDTPI